MANQVTHQQPAGLGNNLPDYGRLIQGVLRAYVGAANELLERDGFALRIEDDLRAWRRGMEQASGTDGINPTFDPDKSGDPLDAYWLHVVGADGRTAGVMAGRYIETDDYHDHVRRGLGQVTHHRPFGVANRPAGVLLAVVDRDPVAVLQKAVLLRILR